MPDYRRVLPDNELSIISTHSFCQATFLGFLWNPKNYAWKLALQDMSRVDGHLIVRDNFWDPRNDAWRLSGNIFGIISHHFWDLALIFWVKRSQNRVTGFVSGHSKGFFVLSDVNLFCRSQHSYHVNHPLDYATWPEEAILSLILTLSWPGLRPQFEGALLYIWHILYCNSELKNVLNITGFVLDMTWFVVTRTWSVSNMTGFVLDMTEDVQKLPGVVLNMTGMVLNMTGCVPNYNWFVLHIN